MQLGAILCKINNGKYRKSEATQSNFAGSRRSIKKTRPKSCLLVNSLNFNRMCPRMLRGCIFNLRESGDFYRCSLLMAQARIYTVIDHKEFRKSILLRNADTPDDRMRSRILPKSSFCSMLSFCHSFLHIG